MKKVVFSSITSAGVFNVVPDLELANVTASQFRLEIVKKCLLALRSAHTHEYLILPLFVAEQFIETGFYLGIVKVPVDLEPHQIDESFRSFAMENGPDNREWQRMTVWIDEKKCGCS